MTYKEIIEEQLVVFNTISNRLCEARDNEKNIKKGGVEMYFQNQVDSISTLRNKLEAEFMKAQTDELKEQLKNK